MASVVFSSLGQSIGSNLGGAVGGAIGSVVGSIIGEALFPSGADRFGPRSDNLKVISSTFGKDINKIYGTARTSTNIIWSTDLIETATEQSGKGSGPSFTTYSYAGNFAVGVCEGEILGISKIWADSILIYNKSHDATPAEIIESKLSFDSISIYTGTEDQLPDALIESYEGVGNVPAFRGLSYIVFEGLDLEKFGRRLPIITVEVSRKGTLSDDWKLITTAPFGFFSTMLASNGTLYATSGLDLYYSNDIGLTWIYMRYFVPFLGNVAELLELYDRDGYFIIKVNSDAWRSLDYGVTWEKFTIAGGSSNRGFSYMGNGVMIVYGLFTHYYSHDYGDNWSTFTLPASIVFYLVIRVHDDLYLLFQSNNVYASYDRAVTWSYRGSWSGAAVIAFSGFYMEDVDTVLISDGDGNIYTSTDKGINWSFVVKPEGSHLSVKYGDNGTILASNGNRLRVSTDYGLTFPIDLVTSGDVRGKIYYGSDCYLITTDSTAKSVYLKTGPLITDATENLSAIASSICIDAGLVSNDVDVTDLTDIVNGYIISEKSASRDYLVSLSHGYSFDVVESDFKLKFVSR